MKKTEKGWEDYEIAIEDPFELGRNLGDKGQQRYRMIIDEIKAASKSLKAGE